MGPFRGLMIHRAEHGFVDFSIWSKDGDFERYRIYFGPDRSRGFCLQIKGNDGSWLDVVHPKINRMSDMITLFRESGYEWTFQEFMIAYMFFHIGFRIGVESTEDEDPGRCPECGKSHEIVRPGKTQPTCDCHLKCEHCGKMKEYYSLGKHPNPKYVKHSGWMCPDCEPRGYVPGEENMNECGDYHHG